MFFSFFKKKNTNPVPSIYKCNKVHYLTVIKGYEIAEIDSSLLIWRNVLAKKVIRLY